MLRVLIVDDPVLFRESLAFLLQWEPDITVSGQVGTLAEARGLLVGGDVALIERAREARAGLGQVTEREPEGLQVRAEGLSDEEIAQWLHVSRQTVHTHMAHILSTFGVESRLRALIDAARYGPIRLG